MHMKLTSDNISSRPFYISLSLLVILVLLIGFIAYTLLVETAGPHTSIENKYNQFLITTNPQEANTNPISNFPLWMLMLIICFGVLQTLPILIAASKAKGNRVTERLIKEINFLCETPMYLGLLGSLLGVCLTQFMTGTLSAPLAYITTISGILLHLFAKFSIIVPLPDNINQSRFEEV